MENRNKCNTCACSSVCKNKSQTIEGCNNWIGNDELTILRDRKAKAPALLLMEYAFRENKCEEAYSIISTELNRAFIDYQNYLKGHYYCDWPFLLSAMKMYANLKIETLDEDMQALTKIIESGAGCMSVNLKLQKA